MPRRKNRPRAKSAEDIAKLSRAERAARQGGYREQALALFPHVCARCGREFAGNRLRELTVHHKDHDHTNNPPDGSNWELLCLYCHDEEHKDSSFRASGSTKERHTDPDEGFHPFENLSGLLGGGHSQTEDEDE